MAVTIAEERPDTEDALVLIAELESYLTPLYPPASQHGLGPEQLIKEHVAFFILRDNGVPAGCGGVKLYRDFAEIKRMYVRPRFRGKGFGKTLMSRLESHALDNSIRLLRLETGIYQPEAIGLYERQNFYRIPPFWPYAEDPLSIFYEKRIV
jgi:putative acetyltransferase